MNLQELETGDFFVLQSRLQNIYYFVFSKTNSEIKLLDTFGNNEDQSWKNLIQKLESPYVDLQKISEKEGRKEFEKHFSNIITDKEKNINQLNKEIISIKEKLKKIIE